MINFSENIGVFVSISLLFWDVTLGFENPTFIHVACHVISIRVNWLFDGRRW
jgi:hypothetical protein